MEQEPKTAQQHKKQIDDYFFSSNYQEALDYTNNVIESEQWDIDSLIMFKRRRAHVYSALNMFHEASEEYISIINNYDDHVSDYFHCALNLIHNYEFKASSRYIDEGIILACDLQQSYYFESLHFLKAIAYAKLGNKKIAKEALQYFDSNDPIWVISSKYPIRGKNLEKMIDELEDK